jgi:DNA-binding CsgD family transcriptional regulator
MFCGIGSGAGCRAMDAWRSTADTAPVSRARRRVDWLADEIVALGRRALPREQYYREVGARLRRVIDSDALCWHTLDPETLLMTSDAPEELLSAGIYTPATASAAGEAIVAGEYMGDGINTFASLARRRVPVAILGETTRGRPERSARYRDVLAPSGIPFEMRAAFVSRGRAWGALHVARRDDKRDFTPADAAALARIGGTIADGIRTSLRFDAARRAHGASAPGLVILRAADDVDLITPPARELLAALRSPALADREDAPPAALVALAAHARRAAHDGRAHSDIVAVPSALGWITLHASLPDGRADGRVAIVLERVASSRVTALRLETHGVTEREREVAVLLARGLSNPEIAETLVLSPYTVQDHIKSLFEKTGVRSRQELVARVFLDDYMPHIAQRSGLTSNGSFAESAPATN